MGFALARNSQKRKVRTKMLASAQCVDRLLNDMSRPGAAMANHRRCFPPPNPERRQVRSSCWEAGLGGFRSHAAHSGVDVLVVKTDLATAGSACRRPFPQLW